MAGFCDVALPVPLDRTFTYAVGMVAPAVGARVLVPFSGQALMGVVVRVHDDTPAGVEVKGVQAVLDEGALLPEELMRLAGWIASYYVAPLGEVLRGMLPLSAEVRRRYVYRIGEAGRRVLYEGAAKGSSRRSKLTAEEQDREYRVLNYLEDGAVAKASALRSATRAGKALLDAMVRKKWLVREAEAEERDARRVEKWAVLREGIRKAGIRDQGSGIREGLGDRDQGLGNEEGEAEPLGGEGQGADLFVPDPCSLIPALRLPRLNENQLMVMAELAAVGALSVDPFVGRADTGRLRRIFVRKGWRRQGIGEWLVTALMVEAKKGYAMVRLRAETPYAARLYERLGFVPIVDENASHERSVD